MCFGRQNNMQITHEFLSIMTKINRNYKKWRIAAMALVESNLIKAIDMVQNKLMGYVEEGIDLCIHLHSNDKSTRNVIVIDEFKISENKLSIVAGWYEINIKNELAEVKYIEEDNSLYIQFSNGDEIYLDPVEAI